MGRWASGKVQGQGVGRWGGSKTGRREGRTAGRQDGRTAGRWEGGEGGRQEDRKQGRAEGRGGGGGWGGNLQPRKHAADTGAPDQKPRQRATAQIPHPSLATADLCHRRPRGEPPGRPAP